MTVTETAVKKIAGTKHSKNLGKLDNIVHATTKKTLKAKGTAKNGTQIVKNIL